MGHSGVECVKQGGVGYAGWGGVCHEGVEWVIQEWGVS